MSPSEEERQAQQRKQDSLRLEQINAQADSIAAAIANQQGETEQRETVAVVADAPDTQSKYQDLATNYGVFAQASIPTNEAPLTVENDFYRLKIGRKGGRIESVELKNIRTFDSLPVFLF
jgi:YidC/Oxa1 family membrane protein insertase